VVGLRLCEVATSRSRSAAPGGQSCLYTQSHTEVAPAPTLQGRTGHSCDEPLGLFARLVCAYTVYGCFVSELLLCAVNSFCRILVFQQCILVCFRMQRFCEKCCVYCATSRCVLPS